MEQEMKIHTYYLATTPWWIINGGLKPIDRHAVLFKIGKALGVIQ